MIRCMKKNVFAPVLTSEKAQKIEIKIFRFIESLGGDGNPISEL